MKKIYSAMVMLTAVFAFAGNSSADTFYVDGNVNTPSLDPITPYDVFFIGNSVSGNSLPSAAGSYLDEWIFSVDAASDFGSTTSSIKMRSSFGLTALNTKLYALVEVDGPDYWELKAENIGVFGAPGSPNSWVSELLYSPLTPLTGYKLEVYGTKLSGNAAYSGTVEIAPITTPVPEPEIYAMLVAGLGLMGFVARRRQLNGVVS